MVSTPTTPCPPFPCPPAPPPPCPQVCPPPPPPAPCRVKPVMRGLHMAQSKSKLTQAILASIFAGTMWYVMVVKPREETYREFYSLSEFDDWAEEMAKKGLFQSTPKESLKDF